MKILVIRKLLGKVIAIALLGSSLSCTKNEEVKPDFLVFGSFFGFCVGEECIEIFRLENGKLIEDTTDQYPSREEFYNGSYIDLSQEKYNEVKVLLSAFPRQLMDDDRTQFGCADCADQGGLYIESRIGSRHLFWILDQDRSNLPAYLHDFADLVNEKIDYLKN